MLARVPGVLMLAAALLCSAGSDPLHAQAPDQLSFRVGPLRVAPYLRIGEIVFDTNVYYDAERISDVSASGGPGLQLRLPLRSLNVHVDGTVDYRWFVRTTSQRRFGGSAGGGLDFVAGPLRLGALRTYTRSFKRPSVEVDRRVLQEDVTTSVYANLTAGKAAGARFRIAPRFDVGRSVVATGTDYLGTDLGRALTQDKYLAAVDLSYGLTPKTSLVLLADQEWYRFPHDATRDSDSNRFAAGFALSSPTRLDGQILAGPRIIRPRDASRGGSRTVLYAGTQLTWHFGAKTRLRGNHSFDTSYSAFDTARGLPTVQGHQAELRLYRRLVGRLEVDIFGRMRALRSDGPVTLRRLDGTVETIRRDDTFYDAGLDLGYAFRGHLRIGGMAAYAKRRTNFRDFGIDGLLMGLTIRYNP